MPLAVPEEACDKRQEGGGVAEAMQICNATHRSLKATLCEKAPTSHSMTIIWASHAIQAELGGIFASPVEAVPARELRTKCRGAEGGDVTCRRLLVF